MWGETQTFFGYDSLNRLTSASATNGLANYNETYQYDSATGNLVNKNGLVLNYPTDGTRPHAVTSAGSNTYGYDNNGNQTTRVIGGQTVTLGYDAENRMVSASGTNLTANFTYNGDGQRVKSVVNGETILFVGGHYELNSTTSEVSKYYFAGASRIAVRTYTVPQTNTLTYLLGDHLGSTSLAVNALTGEVIETRYKAWGEVRWTTESKTLPTRFTFTGQYSYVSDSATDLGAAGFGLMFYNARWYDPYLNRFIQADSIVPGGVQGLDRYSYVGNNPINYTDPSGHFACEFNETECNREKLPKLNHSGLGISHDPTSPDVLDPRLMKEDRAQYLYDLYLEMWNNKKGWWWDAYGAGGFTIWEFMDIFWRWEQSRYPHPSILAAAMANSAYEYCADPKRLCDHQSAEGALSFLAHYSQSAQMRADAFHNKEPFDLAPPLQSTTSMLVVNAIIDRGYGRVGLHDPYAVGNVSMAPGILRKMIRLGYVFDYWGRGNTFVILTYCQSLLYMSALDGGKINQKSYTSYCGG